MAVTINKEKSKTTTAPKTKKVNPQIVESSVEESLQDQLVSAALVDEYAQLLKKIEKHDAKIAAERTRADELKKMFVGAADEFLPPGESLVLLDSSGNSKIEVSAKANQTIMADMADIKKALGTSTFMEIAKVGVADLKAYLPKDKYEQVTTVTQTGARKLKII